MLDTKSPLIAEFLRDHQQFSRLLVEVKKLLSEGKIEKARERAIELDEMAGAHIAYEESELYPRLLRLGNRSVSEEQLVGQHQEVVDALKILLSQMELNEDQRKSVETGFQTGISHAEHCGSLISLVSQLDQQEQLESLRVLKELRKNGKKWSELEQA